MPRRAKHIDLARQLRQNDVPAEELLWKVLRNRTVAGHKFRRQHPIGPYIVDFACVECRLIVEVDGETHLARRREDEQRTRFLEAEGWRVRRFWNTEVYEEFEPVIEAIYMLCQERSSR